MQRSYELDVLALLGGEFEDRGTNKVELLRGYGFSQSTQSQVLEIENQN